jgi:hypothetical protein
VAYGAYALKAWLTPGTGKRAPPPASREVPGWPGL